MSSRGTLRIQDQAGGVQWAYINHSAGDAGKAVERLAKWTTKHPRTSASRIFDHLKGLESVGYLFEPSAVHPFSDEAFGPGDEEERRIFGGGPNNPFNEYEYHLLVEKNGDVRVTEIKNKSESFHMRGE